MFTAQDRLAQAAGTVLSWSSWQQSSHPEVTQRARGAACPASPRAAVPAVTGALCTFYVAVPCASHQVVAVCRWWVLLWCHHARPVQILTCSVKTSGVPTFALPSCWWQLGLCPRQAWKTTGIISFTLNTPDRPGVKSQRLQFGLLLFIGLWDHLGEMCTLTKIKIHQHRTNTPFPPLPVTRGDIVIILSQSDRRKMIFHCFHLHSLNC